MIKINTPGISDASLIDYDSTHSVTAKINELIAKNSYAVCSTAGDTAAKTVTLSNFALGDDVQVVVKFANANTASNITLNINSTGDKPIKVNGEAVGLSVIKANSVFLFAYDGTNYNIVGGVGGSDIFIGTQDEWDDLSASEKAEWDEKIVIITDDYVTDGLRANVRKVVYDETTAIKAHAVDDLVYVNSHLYKVTAPIAIGDTIAENVNITSDTGLTTDEMVAIEGIPNEDEFVTTASNILFDNTSTGLSATNVQNAISEVNTKAYKTDDSASTTIDDTDYIPMSTSAGVKKKSLWSNIKNKLKSVFLYIYDIYNASLINTDNGFNLSFLGDDDRLYSHSVNRSKIEMQSKADGSPNQYTTDWSMYPGNIKDDITTNVIVDPLETYPSNLAAGEYFLTRNDIFRRVTTDVTAGEPWTDNNSETVSIGDVLTELNSNMTLYNDTLDPTAYTSNISVYVNRTFKSNNRVHLSLFVTVNEGSVFPTGTNLCTVPQGYRPSTTIKAPAWICASDNSWHPYTVIISNTGTITQQFTSTCKGLWIDTEYLLNV